MQRKVAAVRVGQKDNKMQSTNNNRLSTLYLIDVYAQIFRAYFAIRTPMHSPVTGEPTNALFGFTGMLFKLLQTHSPCHVLAAFDPPGKTFRDALADDYKANRNVTPDDLIKQLSRIAPLLDAFGIAHRSVDTFEADDLIASVVQTLRVDTDTGNLRIRMISRDKDLEQCLGPNVSLYDIHSDEEITVDSLQMKKGIRPDQVIDFQTMTGDPVDNIPGVEGIGAKTAALLLQEHDTLDNIYAHLHTLSPRRRDNFEKARAQIHSSRELVTLRQDVLPEFALHHAACRPIDLDRLLDLLRELGFNRYQEQARQYVASLSPS